MTDALTTDDDNSLIENPRSTPAWQQYELDIKATIAALDKDAVVTQNTFLAGDISKARRQIDVLAEKDVAGTTHRVVIECKFYKRPLHVGKVDEFYGKLVDVGAERGILYGFSGVTEAGRQRAQNSRNPRIEIRDLDAVVSASPTNPVTGERVLEEARNWAPIIHRTLHIGQCDNENCNFPDVSMTPWEGGEFAGYCDACGTLNIECSECEDTIASGGIGVDTCYACGSEYEVGHDGSGMADSITRVTPAVTFTN